MLTVQMPHDSDDLCMLAGRHRGLLTRELETYLERQHRKCK